MGLPRNLPEAFTGMVVDGKLVMPTPVSKPDLVTVPSNTEAQRIVTGTRRKLADMPALPKELHTLSAILMYTFSGLSDTEISAAMGIPSAQVNVIRSLDAYKQVENYVVQAVKEQVKEEVTDILAASQVKAAKKMTSLVNSVDEKLAFTASKEVLGLNGHTIAQKIDVRQQMDSTFRIEVIDKSNRPQVPIIDMEIDNG